MSFREFCREHKEVILRMIEAGKITDPAKLELLKLAGIELENDQFLP